MRKITLLKGLPGSGKTKWAKNYIKKYPDTKRVNKDDLREMLDDSKWSKESEKFIVGIRNEIIEEAIYCGYSVIVDDTNLHPKHEENLRKLADLHGVEFEVKIFDISLKEAIKNDLKRRRSVGETVIKQMHRQFIKIQVHKVKQNPALPHAIICDLDGTLALYNGRSPYDASTCDQDLVNEPVKQVLLSYKGHIIFVSGRECKYMPQTLGFLDKAIGPRGCALLMRPDGDVRNDYLVKKDIYEQKILGEYYIDFVLDDRNRVVELWRDLGLTCFQVADGDF